MQIIRFLPRIRRSQACRVRWMTLPVRSRMRRTARKNLPTNWESYDKLLTAYETYTTGDIEKAGDALSSVNVDDLSADAKVFMIPSMHTG